jgi:hypothetical protein
LKKKRCKRISNIHQEVFAASRDTGRGGVGVIDGLKPYLALKGYEGLLGACWG